MQYDKLILDKNDSYGRPILSICSNKGGSLKTYEVILRKMYASHHSIEVKPRCCLYTLSWILRKWLKMND